MSRSVQSVVGHDRTSGFSPLNLVKRLSVIAVVSALALVGSSAIAGAATLGSRALNPISPPTVVAGSTTAVATYVATDTDGTGTTAPTSILIAATPGTSECLITLPGETTCTLTGLTNGTAYTATATPSANDTVDTTSAPSASFTPVPVLATPSPVNDGTVGVNVAFTADGTDTLYTVNAWLTTAVPAGSLVANDGAPVSQGNCEVQDTSTPPSGTQICAVTGLTSGTSYTFTVTSADTPNPPAASSSYASVALVVATNIAQPTAVDNGSESAIVTWSANDSADSYVVTSSPVSAGCSVTGTSAPTGSQSCTVNGLTNNVDYTFVVTPSGGTNTSTASPASAPLLVGDLMTPTAADAGVGAAKVSFVADGTATTYTVTTFVAAPVVPATNPPTYTYTAVPADTCTIAVTSPLLTGAQSCTVSGLDNGTLYSFIVTPTGDSAGALASTYSAPITTITPLPTPVAVQSSATTATVYFSPDGKGTTYTVNAQVATALATAPITYSYATSTISCTAVFATAPVAGATTVTTTSAGVQTCVVTGLATGTTYAFTVTPSGGGTTDVTSAESGVITMGASLGTPSALANGPDTVGITWTADGVGTLYTVNAQEVTSLTNLTPIGGTIADVCSFTDTVAPPTGTQTCTSSTLGTGEFFDFTVVPSGNSDGNGPSPASNVVQATLNLGQPTVANAGSGTIGVTFNPDGVATTYTVVADTVVGGVYTPTTFTCIVANSTTPPTGPQNCKVTGLTNGVSYAFTVDPTGGGTTSLISPESATIVPGVAPLATPTTALAGSGAVKVSFAADGVASTYIVTSTPGNFTCTVQDSSTAPTGAQSCTVTGLTNGVAYTFVVAPSGNGTTSAPSLASSPVVPSALTAPTGLATVVTATSIAVTWVDSTNVGGPAVSGYTVTAVAGNSTTSCGTVLATATTCTITGLVPKTTYTVNVTADTTTATETATTSATTLAIALPHALAAHGSAVVGKTTAITVTGSAFEGRPTVKSSAAGVTAWVTHDHGTSLTVEVKVPANGAKGEHTLSIHFSDGTTTKVNYKTV